MGRPWHAEDAREAHDRRAGRGIPKKPGESGIAEAFRCWGGDGSLLAHLAFRVRSLQNFYSRWPGPRPLTPSRSLA